MPSNRKQIPLPRAQTSGRLALERVMFRRRSIRTYTRKSLSLQQFTQLLWSCQGISSKDGLRTTPSAGATYPLEIFAAVENVKGLAPGIYHYRPGSAPNQHSLELVYDGRVGALMSKYSTTQDFISVVPVNIIFTAVTARIRKEYGSRAMRYILLEAGHAAQNLHLQAEAMGLGSVAIGYLDSTRMRALLKSRVIPVYMVSVGHKTR